MYFKRLKRKFRYNRKKRQIFIFLFILLCSLGLAYASITTSLSITGVSKFNNASWDVHFANIQVKNGSVVPTTAPTISNNTTVSFAATLEEPGEYYEFNIDVVNSGTINAMIDSIEILPALTTEQQAYFDYIVTYADGTSLAPTHKLDSGSTEKLRIAFIYKTLDDTTNYPDTDQSFTISVQIDYVQKDNTATDKPAPPPLTTFATDSWETIVSTIQAGGTYVLGSTKEINLGTLGTHTIRVANTSTPDECEGAGFSETACGFVLEFADIIVEQTMNTGGHYKEYDYEYAWNVDGWPLSEMRSFVNSSIYNALPAVLRNAIIDTTVISGHGGTTGETNFTSVDKLYLLSSHEVWENTDDLIGGIDYYDTAYPNTRQLDYYKDLGVTSEDYSGAIKQNNGVDTKWWLRNAMSDNTTYFMAVNDDGAWYYDYAETDYGVSPAFRLAGPVSTVNTFDADSWETIISNVRAGNLYDVGLTKTVDLGSLGAHTVRVANTSTPSECEEEGFSQTACGFVLEFVDAITFRPMNSTDTNVGGWPASELRTYINSTIYDALPSALKSGIIDTTVVSGHGSTSGETNFTSTDKLYLLSTHEVWEDDDSGQEIDDYDSAYNSTRQLDYYESIGVSTNNPSGAIKHDKSSNVVWWLRSAYSSNTNYFYYVGYNGYADNYNSSSSYRITPAFRIG